MSVDQKVTVRCVLVLAHTRFGDGRIFQRRKAARQALTSLSQSFETSNALARIRIDWWSMTVDGNLHAAAVDLRQAISFIFEIDPGWQVRRPETRVTSGRAKIKYFLPRWLNAGADHLGKKFRQPWP